MNSFVTVELINGVDVKTYHPNLKMKMFAAYRANPSYAKYTDEELLVKIGFKKDTAAR